MAKDAWDWESAVTVHPAGKPKAHVQVSFSRDELEYVSEQAEAFGLTVTAYIRLVLLGGTFSATLATEIDHA